VTRSCLFFLEGGGSEVEEGGPEEGGLEEDVATVLFDMVVRTGGLGRAALRFEGLLWATQVLQVREATGLLICVEEKSTTLSGFLQSLQVIGIEGEGGSGSWRRLEGRM